MMAILRDLLYLRTELCTSSGSVETNPTLMQRSSSSLSFVRSSTAKQNRDSHKYLLLQNQTAAKQTNHISTSARHPAGGRQTVKHTCALPR